VRCECGNGTQFFLHVNGMHAAHPSTHYSRPQESSMFLIKAARNVNTKTRSAQATAHGVCLLLSARGRWRVDGQETKDGVVVRAFSSMVSSPCMPWKMRPQFHERGERTRSNQHQTLTLELRDVRRHAPRSR